MRSREQIEAEIAEARRLVRAGHEMISDGETRENLLRRELEELDEADREGRER